MILSRDGRTRTCVSVLPKHVGEPLPYIPQSVRTAGFEPAISCTPSRRDSQTSLRSDGSSSCGSRTRLPGLKGQCPRTDRRTSRSRRAPSTQLTIMVSAQPSRSGSGGARIRVSWSSARRYTISATDPTTKKARCPCDTGLSILQGDLRPSVTSARDTTGAYSPMDRRRCPYPFVVLHSAVRKSWLSPDSLQAARQGLPLLLLYRMDAAEAEKVQGNFRKLSASRPEDKIPRVGDLFPGIFGATKRRAASRTRPASKFRRMIEVYSIGMPPETSSSAFPNRCGVSRLGYHPAAESQQNDCDRKDSPTSVHNNAEGVSHPR